MRLEKRNKRELLHEELAWDRTRTLMAWIANTNPYRKKGAIPVKPHEIIRLSFDKVHSEERFLTPEEVEKKFGKMQDPIRDAD